MHFGSPVYLLTLLVVPLALIVALVVRRRPTRYPLTFTNLEILATVAGSARPRRGLLPLLLLLLALASAATAMAHPRLTRTKAQADAVVVMLVDVSGSMGSNDITPTRITAAVNAMRAFVGKLPDGADVGLVEFSTAPFVVELPTTNHGEIVGALSLLAPGGATALSAGLETAIGVVRSTLAELGARRQGSKALPGVIVLLSDGAQNRGTMSPLQAAAEARADGIRVDTIAFGTPNGTMRFPGFPGAVPVPPDPATMRAIASETGGTTFAARTAAETSSIYGSLGSTIARSSERYDVASWFAAGAAVLLLAAVGLGLRFGALFA